MTELGEEAAYGLNSIKPITEGQFKLFQSLVYKEAGIFLSQAKKALLVGRLAGRLRELGLKSYGDYYDLVVSNEDGGELVLMLDRISTNETHFFREPAQWDFLESEIIPELKNEAEMGQRPPRVRVWSAACSSGEEPYTIAMVLRAAFPLSSGWSLEILATDLSTKMLDRARAAVWPLDKSSEIPERYLKPFMLRGTRSQEGKMKAGPDIRSIITFDRLNLNDPVYPVKGPFDLIFCRNVLIYFDAQSKSRVIHRLLERLDPRGYFFLGHAESLNGISQQARIVLPTIYSLAEKRPAHKGPSR